MQQPPSSRRQVLSVSQLNRTAKQALESALPSVWVEGELTNFSRPSSGHWYFSLKDSGAQVRCAMFRGRNFAVRFKPENGTKVVVRASVSLYEGRGDYQLIVDQIEPAGAGDLQLQFEQIKAKLLAEGLLDSGRKRQLPKWPRKLALVTSPTGAAVHDILQVLRRRYPLLPVVICPTPVQGKEAAVQIVRAIEQADQHSGASLIVVARGGGSLEDLWPFNEEIVARAVANAKLPVVSAVGHEVDFTICDLVADVRAPTPSAAAEIIAPNQDDLADTFSLTEQRLRRQMRHTLALKQHQLRALANRIRHPQDYLRQQSQKLDQLEMRLARAWQHRIQSNHQSLQLLKQRLTGMAPQQSLTTKQNQLDSLQSRLRSAVKTQLRSKRAEMEKHLAVLHNLSPLQTLQRGYAIVKNRQGKVLIDSEQTSHGERLTVQLKQGQLLVLVDQPKPKIKP